MAYKGSFPVSRIEIVDSNLTLFAKEPVRLFGVSSFKIQDANASGIPAISFVIDVPPSNATEVAVMLSLPSALLGNGTTVEEKDGLCPIETNSHPAPRFERCPSFDPVFVAVAASPVAIAQQAVSFSHRAEPARGRGNCACRPARAMARRCPHCRGRQPQIFPRS